MVPAPVAVPRGALWAADAVVAAHRFVLRLVKARPADAATGETGCETTRQATSQTTGQAASKPDVVPGTYRRRTPTLFAIARHNVWRALAAHGHRRAAAELRLQAQRWQSIDPAVAKQLREAAEFNPNEEA